MRTISVFAVLFFVLGCASDNEADAPREIPLLRLEAHDMAFTAPARALAGLTRIRLINNGPSWHEAAVARLPEGATADAYLAEARAGESFPVKAVDFGGPGLIAAGDSSEVVVSLAPGRYAIVCWRDDHLRTGMIASLVIVGDSSAASVNQASSDPPALADTAAITGEIRLEDFRFAHDSGVFRAGVNALRVRNVGQRPHDMTIVRIEPGRTPQDFGVWSATRQGPPPAVPVGGISTLAPGKEGLVQLNLTSGRYLVTCGTPEKTDKGVQIHARMGMVKVFEIP